MKTLKQNLWLVAAALLALPLAGLQAEENTPRQGHGEHKGKGGAAVLAHLAKREACIQKHIEKLTAAAAKHPKAPANVQADVQNLLQDLAAKKGTVQQLIADVQAKDKEAAKADRVQLKALCATIKVDRQTLRADIQAHRAARQAQKGQHPAKG